MGKRKQKKSNNLDKKELRKKLIRYSLIVTIFSFVFFALINQPFFQPISDRINSFYAMISGSILNLFGANVNVNQTEIGSSFFNISVRAGCDAFAPMILFIMAILAFPVAFKLKISSILKGIIALAILNIIRIVTLYYSGLYGSQQFFEIIHEDVWQIFFVAFTVFLWLIWIRSVFLHKMQHDIA